MTMRTKIRKLALSAAGALHADEVLRRWSRPGTFRVLNLHGTPRREAGRLRELLVWVREHFDLLEPSSFLGMLRGDIAPPARPAVLFTFDDGLRSNYDVAAHALEAEGTRGWFFVNPRFAETSPARSRAFFAAHVRYLTDPRSLGPEDYTPMVPSEIRELSERGHGIGSHTLSHALLRGMPRSDALAEISVSRQIIEEWTGVTCEAFAWTFAWDAIDDEAWLLARRHYAICFGACPGPNRFGRTPSDLIHRTNVESWMSVEESRLLATGLADPAWRARRDALESRFRALTKRT